MKRKQYTNPLIERIELDSSISLVMMTPPTDPGPRSPLGTKKGGNDFSNPFDNKPFDNKPFG